MKKNVFILSIGLILLTGCDDHNNEVLQDVNAYEAGTVINSSENWTETAPSISEEVSCSEELIVELPSYLYKMLVFFDERGNLVLDNDGYCYQYNINIDKIGVNVSEPKLVFGEAYEEMLNNRKVSCYPIKLSEEKEDILLGTLVQGTYFYPNSEYFDEDYLWDKVTGEGVCGYIENISEETVSIFTGTENWLYDDTYLELIEISENPIDLQLAPDVRFALLDRNFCCTKVTDTRFHQKINQYAQMEKPAGPIFLLDIEDGVVVQIREHYNP